jgi:hypothetical protein
MDLSIPRWPNYCPFCGTHTRSGGTGSRFGTIVCSQCNADYTVEYLRAYAPPWYILGMSDRKTPFWPWIVAMLVGISVLHVASFGPIWAADDGVALSDAPRVHSYAVSDSMALQEISFDWTSRTLLGRNGGLGTRPICVLVALTDPLEDAQPLHTMTTCTHAYFGRTADEFVAFDRPLRQWFMHARTNPARAVEGLELPDGATVAPLQVRRSASGNAIVGCSTVRLKSDEDFEYRTFVIDLATKRGKWGPDGYQPVFIGDSEEICFVDYKHGVPRSRIMRISAGLTGLSEFRACEPAVVGISVSADGRQIAGVELRPTGGRRIVVYDMHTKAATYPVPTFAETFLPIYSPRDEGVFAFYAYSQLPEDDDARANEKEIRPELHIRLSSGRVEKLSTDVDEFTWDREGRALMWISSNSRGKNVKLTIIELSKR